MKNMMFDQMMKTERWPTLEEVKAACDDQIVIWYEKLPLSQAAGREDIVNLIKSRMASVKPTIKTKG